MAQQWSIRRDEARAHTSLAGRAGGEAFTNEIQVVVDADIERFQQDTGPVDTAPFPELLVSWHLVAALPQVLGARVRTTELTARGDDGRVTTAWYDVAAGTSVSSETMADVALDELAARVLEAGGADSHVDAQRQADELADDEQAFDALAFSTDGRVLVELDQGTVAGGCAGRHVPPVPHVGAQRRRCCRCAGVDDRRRHSLTEAAGTTTVSPGEPTEQRVVRPQSARGSPVSLDAPLSVDGVVFTRPALVGDCGQTTPVRVTLVDLDATDTSLRFPFTRWAEFCDLTDPDCRLWVGVRRVAPATCRTARRHG